jgi:hypothetical protein
MADRIVMKFDVMELDKKFVAQSRDVHRNVCSVCHNIQRGVHSFFPKIEESPQMEAPVT